VNYVLNVISQTTCLIPHGVGVLQQLLCQFGVVAIRKQGENVVEKPHKVLPCLRKNSFTGNNECHLEFLSMPIQFLDKPVFIKEI
jgi:hypothetical protein